MIAVQELLDDGKDIFRLNADAAFLHKLPELFYDKGKGVTNRIAIQGISARMTVEICTMFDVGCTIFDRMHIISAKASTAKYRQRNTM